MSYEDLLRYGNGDPLSYEEEMHVEQKENQERFTRNMDLSELGIYEEIRYSFSGE